MIIVSDIGGTNARFHVWNVLDDSSLELATAITYTPSHFMSLAAVLQQLWVDIDAQDLKQQLSSVVLAVCGPVWEGGRKNESNNIPAWCPPGKAVSFNDADAIEASLGWRRNTITFMNDFEAVGYCVSALVDPRAPIEAKPSPPLPLHAAPPLANAPACCVGAGTGLGACLVVPIPANTSEATSSPDASGRRFTVLPSEAGMTDTICPRNDKEWRLLQFLRKKHGDYVEVERIVSGPGIVDVLEFLAADGGVLDPSAAADVAAADDETKAAVIARYAQSNTCQLCSEAIHVFLTYYGRFLGVAANTFLSYGGLYIAGGILPKLSWALTCLAGNGRHVSGPTAGAGAAAAVPDVKPLQDPLISAYLDQGPKMSDTVARVPLWLLNDPDAGLKGALYVASQKLVSSSSASATV